MGMINMEKQAQQQKYRTFSGWREICIDDFNLSRMNGLLEWEFNKIISL